MNIAGQSNTRDKISNEISRLASELFTNGFNNPARMLLEKGYSKKQIATYLTQAPWSMFYGQSLESVYQIMRGKI